MPIATKLGKEVNKLDGLLSIYSPDPLIMWSYKSCGKLKALYLYYQNTSNHRTWQVGDT